MKSAAATKPRTEPPEDRLLTITQVAELMNVSYTKAKRIIFERLSYMDLSNGINRCVRVRASEVERFLTSCNRAPERVVLMSEVRARRAASSSPYHIPRRK
nr:MAG TPA: putative excisionase [Caudoviricetes sp.]